MAIGLHKSDIKNPVIRWVDERLPVFTMMNKEYGTFPTPRNFNYFWNFGALAMINLMIMIATGIFLAMNYTPHTAYAFDSVERIMRDVNYGWLIRYIHSNGASMFFIAVYIHIFRGLYYGSYKAPREVLWLLGIVIYLLMMATGFLGYTLPWGQMSFWGATVITNFFSSIDQVLPGVGSAITQWLWGSFAVDNTTLQRFFSLHYLLPFVIAGVVVLHVWALHVPGNNNPLGIDVKSPADTVPFHPYYTIKDLFALAMFVLFFSYFIFFYPNFLGHADNYIPADRLVTPPHIVPEWYYLPFYAILRSVPDQLAGVVLMFGAIVIWAFLPWLDRSHVRSNNFRPLNRQFFFILIGVVWILGMLGAQTPDGNFQFYFGIEVPISKLLLTQICTVWYFAHFIIITPIISTMEKPLPVPESIATAVLAKGGASAAAKANG